MWSIWNGYYRMEVIAHYPINVSQQVWKRILTKSYDHYVMLVENYSTIHSKKFQWADIAYMISTNSN